MTNPPPDGMEKEDTHKFNLKILANTVLEALTLTNYMEWLDTLTEFCPMEDAG